MQKSIKHCFRWVFLQIPYSSVDKPTDIKDSLILRLKKELDDERAKSEKLRVELQLAKQKTEFGIDRFKGNPIDFSFYTGIPDYMTFLSFCDFLQPERHVVSTLYYDCKELGSNYVNIRGREPTLSVQEQLFMVLCRLRQGYRELDLSHRFGVSIFTVSAVFSKWIKHMAHILDQLPTWASREVVDENMPLAFRDINYEKTRCIVDCTEIFIQQPSSNLAMQSVLFSTYKNHHTAKGLIAIAPHGPITFVSDLYAGSASDYDITKDCGILTLLAPGDHVMADKGFEIQHLLDRINVRVDHPPILRGVTRMSAEQETQTRRIARLRIHVERAIERVKNFRILQETFQYSQWRLLNDIWKTCAKLTHLQPSIIEDC